MITLSVLGILLALAAPDFRRIIQQNLIDSEVSGLQNLLMSARGEAIKRGQTVWVSSAGSEWTGVITAFVDEDGDFTQSGSEATLFTMAALRETVLVSSAGLKSGIGYAGNGNIRGASAFNSATDSLDIQVPTLVGYPNHYVGRFSFALSGRTIAPRFKTPSASASTGVYQ
jgi:Tfp pilus assembly protein FimT